MLSPYLLKLVTFDVSLLILLVFSGKGTTQLRRGGKFLIGLCANHSGSHGERMTIYNWYTVDKAIAKII